MFRGPVVQVVAPPPYPPPSIVVMPEASACSWSCAEFQWTWTSSAPGVTIFPSAG